MKNLWFKGFMTKCAEHGVDYDTAYAMCKRKYLEKSALFDNTSQNILPFLKDFGTDVKNMATTTVNSVGKDPVNNGVMPGLVGALGGGIVGNLLHSDDPNETLEENRRRRNRKMLVGALLAGLGMTVANAHGMGSKYMPKVDNQ